MHIEIPALSDMHVHLRQGALLTQVAPFTDRCCSYALVMPNTEPPVTDVVSLQFYRNEVSRSLRRTKPLMTFKLLPTTTPELIRELAAAGAIAGKLYPEGVTTNSEDGIGRGVLLNPVGYRQFWDCLGAMEKAGLVLCLHGEMPGEFCLDREVEFLPFVRFVLSQFPKLKVVLEHITTWQAVEFVRHHQRDNLAATITAHHLLLTLDDVIGDKLNPHNFCKPVPKGIKDRAELWVTAISGNPRFFLGSDSAPHSIYSKHCNACCAGVFTAPVLPELLVTGFEEGACVGRLADFTSGFANQFYGLTPVNRTIRLVKENWRVPEIVCPAMLMVDGVLKCDGVVPFYSGKYLSWKLEY